MYDYVFFLDVENFGFIVNWGIRDNLAWLFFIFYYFDEVQEDQFCGWYFNYLDVKKLGDNFNIFDFDEFIVNIMFELVECMCENSYVFVLDLFYQFVFNWFVE